MHRVFKKAVAGISALAMTATLSAVAAPAFASEQSTYGNNEEFDAFVDLFDGTASSYFENNDYSFCENREEILQTYYDLYLSTENEVNVNASRASTLNSSFTYLFSELQQVARTYINSLDSTKSYNYNTSDEFYGMKDVWYSFYLLRYMKATVASDKNSSYMNIAFKYFGGDEELVDNKENGSFMTYVKQTDSSLYSGLLAVVNGSIKTYATSKQTLDLPHFAASMTVYLYDGSKTAVNTLMNGNYADYIHDNYACWAGDLQELIAQAYDSKSYDNLHDAVYAMMGDENYKFGMKDFYADTDAVNIRYILDSYRVNKKTGDVSMEDILTSYYSQWPSHVSSFLNTLWYEKVWYYTTTYPELRNLSFLGNASSMTEKERQQATLGFIDFCEDTFQIDFNMLGYSEIS